MAKKRKGDKQPPEDEFEGNGGLNGGFADFGDEIAGIAVDQLVAAFRQGMSMVMRIQTEKFRLSIENSETRQAWAEAHKALFDSLVAAGFTADQAMELLKYQDFFEMPPMPPGLDEDDDHDHDF